MHTRVRVLPHEEWPRLVDVPDSPFARAQVLPDPDYATVLVEEDEQGQIVGTWMITSIMLLEGLWRRADIRGDGVGAKKLLFGMLGFMRDRDLSTAITVIQDDAVVELARKVGFERIPGDGGLYTIRLKKE